MPLPDPDLGARLSRELDRGGEAPLSTQIVEQVWLEVVTGMLDSGQRLPTVRQLAIDLGVSPRTVERAYTQLEKLGVVSVRQGQGTFVSLAPPSPTERERYLEVAGLCQAMATRAAELGFGIDDLIDLLGELRPDRHGNGSQGDSEWHPDSSP